jgi:hypothetical protein
VKGRARRQINAARARYEESWVQAIAAQLKALHVFEWTTIFGAELLWSALPFIILLSSLANQRIDDDASCIWRRATGPLKVSVRERTRRTTRLGTFLWRCSVRPSRDPADRGKPGRGPCDKAYDSTRLDARAAFG